MEVVAANDTGLPGVKEGLLLENHSLLCRGMGMRGACALVLGNKGLCLC